MSKTKKFVFALAFVAAFFALPVDPSKAVRLEWNPTYANVDKVLRPFLLVPLLGLSGIAYTPSNAFLNRSFRGTAYTDPTTFYYSLFTATPSDSGGGTEAAYTSYARVSVACNTTNYATASTIGSIANSVAITYPTSTGGTSVVTQYGIHDAASGGNLHYWADLTTSKTINSGDVPSAAIGAYVVGYA